MAQALQERNIYHPNSPIDCKKSCLGHMHMENSPRCLACDDYKECISLKLRWEKKTKDHYLSQHTVTKISVTKIGNKKEVIVKKSKSKEDLLNEFYKLDELSF